MKTIKLWEWNAQHNYLIIKETNLISVFDEIEPFTNLKRRLKKSYAP